MKIISYKNKYKMNVSIVWFCEDINDIKEKYDMIEIRGYKNKIDKAFNNLQFSLLLDLSKEEEELFNDIKKNVKYEINRCYKEKVEYKVYTTQELTSNNEILKKFEKTYNQMYKEKMMDDKLSLDIVKRYIEEDCFVLTSAVIEGKELVYHAYVTDNTKTRLLYSCSTFRNNEKEEKNLIARANKFLHWEDIKHFKNKGIDVYDFGGIKSFEEPNGIDKFKMAFGGEKTEYYNIIYPNTRIGKIYLKLKKLIKRK